MGFARRRDAGACTRLDGREPGRLAGRRATRRGGEFGDPSVWLWKGGAPDEARGRTMKVVLDTSVFVPGVFFPGPPREVLRLWRDGEIELALSAEILEEYRRVGRALAKPFPNTDLEPVLDLVSAEGSLVEAPPLDEAVCEDRADDKFLACALASECETIVSSDRHLLKVSGYRGVRVMKPSAYLRERGRGHAAQAKGS